MKHFVVVLVMLVGVFGRADARPRGSYKSSSRSSGGWGTGSKSSSRLVRGYTTKRGTYVAPHRRTTSDGTQHNNDSTKGNYNPSTGKRGSKPVRR